MNTRRRFSLALALLALCVLPVGIAHAGDYTNKPQYFAGGVTIPSGQSLKANTINESVPGAGVTMESVNVKDGAATTSFDAPYCGNATCTEYGVGAVHRTLLTVDHAITITDAGAAGAQGSLKLYTFNGGMTLFLGAYADLAATCGTTGLTATATNEIGIGTAAAGVDNATLTGDEETIITGSASDLVDSAEALAASNVVQAALDGTSTPVPVWLNFVFAADDATDNDSCDITGTVVLVWANMSPTE